MIFQDEVLIEGPIFEEFWERDVEESVRQRNTKPFIEETVLQVSNWGFSLADLQVRKECKRGGILSWLRSMYSQEQCELAGFLGPIHIWQVCTYSLYCFIILILVRNSNLEVNIMYRVVIHRIITIRIIK